MNGLNKKRNIFVITETDIQETAQEHINRKLTRAEMERFKQKFTIYGWVKEVKNTIDNIMNKDVFCSSCGKKIKGIKRYKNAFCDLNCYKKWREGVWLNESKQTNILY